MTLESDKKTKKENQRRWCSPFLCVFREDELDVVLCVKASEFMHTRKHTHSFLSTDLISPFQGDDVKECWQLLLRSVNLCTSTQCFSTFHRMTWQQPENLLVLVFHFTSGQTKIRVKDSNLITKKIAPFTLDCWAVSVAKLDSLFSLSNC